MAFHKNTHAHARARTHTHTHTHTQTHTNTGGLRQFLAMIISTGRRDISVWEIDPQFGEKSSRLEEIFPFAT